MIKVDSNQQIIDYSDYLSMKLREHAENRRELSHYCSIETAKKILESKTLLFKCVNEYTKTYNRYERDWIDGEYRGIIFLSCLTHGPESEDFWLDFADSGHGVKLTFRTKGIFHKEIIDTSKYIQGINEEGKIAAYFATTLSCEGNLFCRVNDKLSSDIVAEIVLTDVDYDINPLQTVQQIDAKKYLNLSTISRIVRKDYEQEYETRMIAILRSTKPITIEELSCLLVPLNFNNVNFDIAYGSKVSDKEKRELESLVLKV